MFPYVDENNLDGLATVVRGLEAANRELRQANERLQTQNEGLWMENMRLQAENTELRGRSEKEGSPAKREAKEGKPDFVKPNRPKRAEGQARKKRAKGFGRKREKASEQVVHKVARCEHCNCALSGGSVKRTRQVLHVALTPVQVVEHVFVERRCPLCKRRYVPKAQEVLEGVAEKHRLSIATMALIASLREVGRLPIRTIQWYLQTFHALTLSVGAIVDVLHAVAKKGQAQVQRWLQELQTSPVVHGDETTWREDGQNGYMWVFSTPTLRYFVYRHSRSGEIVNEVLGEGFTGALVSDFYGGYNRMLGVHQRCWAHLLRDMHELKEKHPADAQLHTWAEKVHELYERARAHGPSHAQATAAERHVAQRAFEQELLMLCKPHLDTDDPQHVLCKRIEQFLSELFTFVGDPRVPSDNNAAERSIRPLAVSRKISGGTRSDDGTTTKSVLAALFGSWLLRKLNPFSACTALMLPP